MTAEEEFIILKRLEKLERGILKIETLSLRLPSFGFVRKNRRVKKVKKNY